MTSQRYPGPACLLGDGPESGASRHAGRLYLALALVAGFTVVEVVAGFWTNSLALLSDAGHMVTDTLGLGMASAAVFAAARRRSVTSHSFGLYRLEVLAALANATLLFGVAAYILYEAVGRLQEPPPLPGLEVLMVGILGLLVNIATLRMLHAGQGESLNIRGAYLEVLADLLGSIGVIISAVIIWTTGFHLVDPILGALIGLFVLPRAWRLGFRALRVLLQATPPHLDLQEIEADLLGIAGAEQVHDLHAWTLTSGIDLLSAHIVVSRDAPRDEFLQDAQARLEARFGIRHATLQVEGEACGSGKG